MPAGQGEIHMIRSFALLGRRDSFFLFRGMKLVRASALHNILCNDLILP
jgi:hypothetical protein